MGTRSVTVVAENDGDKVVGVAAIYRQFDGYFSGHGRDIAEYLKGKPLVNGISDDKPCFNGLGDLAFRLVAHLHNEHKKTDEPGNFYLCTPPDLEQGFSKVAREISRKTWADYVYFISPMEKNNIGGIRLTVHGSTGEQLFDGPVEDFVYTEEE